MARMFSLLALVAMIVGCEPGASQKKQMDGEAAPSWPALQALQGNQGMMTVGMAIGREGPKAAKAAAAAPDFKKLVDDFDKAPIPSAFASPARQTAKKNLVEALRKIAESGSDEEIKTLWQQATDDFKTIGSS